MGRGYEEKIKDEEVFTSSSFKKEKYGKLFIDIKSKSCEEGKIID